METYSHELADELRKRVDLELRTLPGRPDGMPPRMLSLLGFGVTTGFYLARNARRFDVVHVGDMALWPFALIVQLFARRVRVVAAAHGTDVAYPLRVGLRPRLYAVFLHIGALMTKELTVIANSHATAALSSGAGYRDVCVVPLGVRLISGDGDGPQPEPYVLFVGRLIRRKGCGWFIRNVLSELDDRIRLVVAATAWDAEESAALEADRVEFLGPVRGARLTDLRQRALAVIVPNISCSGHDFEGFGLAALEAAADGSILLASRLDGIVDAVIDGETGFLLPAEKPQAWVDKIHEIAHWSLDQRRAFVRRSRARLRQSYSWQRVADQTIWQYQR